MSGPRKSIKAYVKELLINQSVLVYRLRTSTQKAKLALSKMQLILIVLLSAYFTPIFSFDSYNYVFEYKHSDTIFQEFKTGDIIACKILSSVGSAVVGAEHTMLATSLTKVAHVDGNGKGVTYGYIKEEPFQEVVNRGGYTLCRIANTQYDLIMFNKVLVSPRSSDEASSAALNWVNKYTYYDFTGCNCQHWVTEWRYGKAWSPQSNQPPNQQCALQNHFSAGSFAQGNAYSKPMQAGAKYEASTGKLSGGSGILNGGLSGPSASFSASAGQTYTGVGFEARIGQGRSNLGNSFGVSHGLAVDTGVGLGSDGARLEVLGTGFQYSRSSGGLRLCFLGSCAHIG